MQSIASDSEEPDLACTMTAIGNPSISRVPVPCSYSSTSSSVVKGLSGGYLKLSNIYVQGSTWMGDHLVGCSSYTTPKGML